MYNKIAKLIMGDYTRPVSHVEMEARVDSNDINIGKVVIKMSKVTGLVHFHIRTVLEGYVDMNVNTEFVLEDGEGMGEVLDDIRERIEDMMDKKRKGVFYFCNLVAELYHCGPSISDVEKPDVVDVKAVNVIHFSDEHQIESTLLDIEQVYHAYSYTSTDFSTWNDYVFIKELQDLIKYNDDVKLIYCLHQYTNFVKSKGLSTRDIKLFNHGISVILGVAGRDDLLDKFLIKYDDSESDTQALTSILDTKEHVVEFTNEKLSTDDTMITFSIEGDDLDEDERTLERMKVATNEFKKYAHEYHLNDGDVESAKELHRYGIELTLLIEDYIKHANISDELTKRLMLQHNRISQFLLKISDLVNPVTVVVNDIESSMDLLLTK